MRVALAYAVFVWGHEIDHTGIMEKLRKLNRLAMNTYSAVPGSVPMRGMELITDTMPLHLYLVKMAIATFTRVHKQTPLEWEGMYENKNYSSVTYGTGTSSVTKSASTRHLLDSDRCDLIAPKQAYQVDLSSFRGGREYREHQQYNIYTDGSKTGTKVGSGFLILQGEQTMEEGSLRLPTTSSVFQAEIYAILSATRTLIIRNVEGLRQVKFFVDSQAALRALQTREITSTIVHQTVAALNNLSEKAEVTLVWTKAHVGTLGNERADELAKAGSELEEVQPVNAPKSKLKAEIDEKIREKWDADWQRYPHGRQTRFFYPGQDKQRAKEVMQLNRIELGCYIRL